MRKKYPEFAKLDDEKILKLVHLYDKETKDIF